MIGENSPKVLPPNMCCALPTPPKNDRLHSRISAPAHHHTVAAPNNLRGFVTDITDIPVC